MRSRVHRPPFNGLRESDATAPQRGPSVRIRFPLAAGPYSNSALLTDRALTRAHIWSLCVAARSPLLTNQRTRHLMPDPQREIGCLRACRLTVTIANSRSGMPAHWIGVTPLTPAHARRANALSDSAPIVTLARLVISRGCKIDDGAGSTWRSGRCHRPRGLAASVRALSK